MPLWVKDRKSSMDVNEIWKEIRDETKKRAEAEPVLASFFHTTVLEHD